MGQRWGGDGRGEEEEDSATPRFGLKIRVETVIINLLTSRDWELKK